MYANATITAVGRVCNVCIISSHVVLIILFQQFLLLSSIAIITIAIILHLPLLTHIIISLPYNFAASLTSPIFNFGLYFFSTDSLWYYKNPDSQQSA